MWFEFESISNDFCGPTVRMYAAAIFGLQNHSYCFYFFPSKNRHLILVESVVFQWSQWSHKGSWVTTYVFLPSSLPLCWGVPNLYPLEDSAGCVEVCPTWGHPDVIRMLLTVDDGVGVASSSPKSEAMVFSQIRVDWCCTGALWWRELGVKASCQYTSCFRTRWRDYMSLDWECMGAPPH